jgi:DNA-binding MarR family transcriptional regulator/GNAT superfamily N-acetyltransferase
MPASATTEVSSDAVAAFRRFNRLYTRFIGTLDEVFLDSDFTLSEARLLYELATRTAPKASELAESLGIDPGYLSRVLAKFERSGLLRKKASAKDARYAELLLTARGRAAFQKLNDLSEQQARSILSNLPLMAGSDLIGGMQSIERLLGKPDAAQAPFVLRPHRIGDMGWVVYSEAIGYGEQFGWDASFEALVAKIVQEFLANFDPARERCWIAELDGQHVGHIFLVKHPSQTATARLRLLFVDRSARGRGLGETLVQECIRFARTAGYRKVVLWTQSILTSAHRLYQKAGFRLVKEDPHHSFGQDLIGQEWELELT